MISNRNLIRPGGGLIYPAGYYPGFDPTHPLAKGVVRYSGVAQANGIFVNLLNGVPNTAVGSPSRALTPFGLAARSLQSTDYQTGGAGPSETPSQWTYAAIVPDFNLGNPCVLVQVGTGATNVGLGINGTSVGSNISGFGFFASTITTLINDSPYFIIASASGGSTGNVLALNLKTGVILTGTINSGGLKASNGNYKFVAGNAGGRVSQATVMYSVNYAFSASELLQIAANPWSFWFPQSGNQFVGSISAPSFWLPYNRSPLLSPTMDSWSYSDFAQT